MAEYKKEIGVAVVIALLAGLGVGLFSLIGFQSSVSCPVDRCPGNPMISVGASYCSLVRGACDVTLTNVGTTSQSTARTIACEFNLISGYTANGKTTVVESSMNSTAKQFEANVTTRTVTTWHVINGTNQGPAAVIIPAGGSATGTCVVDTALLAHETVGATANGCFAVKFVNGTGNIPYYCFQSIWS